MSEKAETSSQIEKKIRPILERFKRKEVTHHQD